MKKLFLIILSFISIVGYSQEIQLTKKLLPLDGKAYQLFGYSVSISDNYAIIGAYRDNENGGESGASYIFYNNNDVWEQQSKIIASDGSSGDFFGFSVSISGNYAIVGSRNDFSTGVSSGSAYIFFNNEGIWEQYAKLVASDSINFAHFGCSVCISGDYAIVGADGEYVEGYNPGAAYVFYNNNGVWEEQGKITALDGQSDDMFGHSVSISNDYAIVGAFQGDNNGNNSGSAYIYQNNNGFWEQIAKLIPSDNNFFNQFGISVSISGDKAIVGASSDRVGNNNILTGSAYIYQNNNGNWEETRKLVPADTVPFKRFGYSVSIDDNNVVVGAYSDNLKGSAYAFQKNNGLWDQQAKLTSYDGAFDDEFGYSVSISGDNTIIGAFHFDDDFGTNSGACYIFQKKGVFGKVYNDFSEDCINDANEIGLTGRKAIINPGNIFVETGESGTWYIDSLAAGDYTITADTTGKWLPTCPITQNFTVIHPDSVTIAPSFGFVSTEPCAEPYVSINMPIMRRCFSDRKIYVQACNTILATGALLDAYVELELDSVIIPTNSSIPYADLGDNLYRFDIGTLNPGMCEDFWVEADVSCDAELGQTLCMQANLFPADSCVFDTTPNPGGGGVTPCELPWDKSSLFVRAWCQNDSVYFFITNTGDFGEGDMVCWSEVRIYIDGEFMQLDSVMLAGGETQIFTFAGDGRTWRLEADQHPLHPGNSHPNATVENCGNSDNWTPGLVTILPSDDADPVVDIYCGEVTGSYDPNDKASSPVGVGLEHFIYPDGKLDYTVRFQNTGTDTAFTVVIRDTLETDLDIFTVEPGASSHDCSFRMYGARVLEWTFNNILLPDSNVNEAESHGFVSFTVNQVSDLPDGTEINNNAGIYFDYNEPVITNTTSHIINRNLITTSWTEEKTVTAEDCNAYIYNGISYTQTGTYWQIIEGTVDTLVTIDLNILESTSSNITVVECESYTAPDETLYTSSGIYTAVIPNAAGCDSTITIDLTINTADVSLSVSGNTITANATDAGYQWVDCDNSNIPIAGETNQSFTPSINGNYAVNVTQNGCTDRSVCTAITSVSVEHMNNVFTLYPNPTTGIIKLTGFKKQSALIQITDITGKVLIEKSNIQQNEELDLSGFANGIYIIRIQTEDEVFTSKIVKE